MKVDDTMTIRQMCDEYGVTARTLRFYETKELLSPIRDGQRRLYTKRDRARLKLILRGKKFGLTLEKIRQMLNLYDMDDAGQTQLTCSLDLANERLVELTQQRDELNLTLDELAGLIKWGETKIQPQKTTNTSSA